ncbi:hypothetical protein CVIRNUC_004840 [Coccomyxa viridis]|uniref:Uncharacterized protein n=1 Tax=Coccomyxa viridis TaxID=1274662 RepID=A0AAV1I5Z9_9CHLO|nr:hypothetical protein CVIRNUC_004840 [Coccomyxa viridis]
MSMRQISRELAAEDDSHLYRVKTAKAGGISLDQGLRMHDEAEMSRPRRKSPLVTLGNVAMLAAAAGIATALCREVQDERRVWKGSQARPVSASEDVQYVAQPHPLKVQLDLVMARQRELQDELESMRTRTSNRHMARKRKEVVHEQSELTAQHAKLMEAAKQMLLRGAF